MTDYEDYNNLAFPPQELSEVDILRAENKALQKKLGIAVEALEVYMTFCRHPAQEALAKIKEIK